MPSQSANTGAISRRILVAAAITVAASFFSSMAAYSQQLRVAAAADLQFAMKDLAARYERQSNQKVEIVYGSSGNFSTQIENGAPFDLFFSADSSYPAKLIEHGLADRQSLYRYAIGRLVLWASQDEHLDVAKNGFQVLLDPRVSKIAIANPEHAPYGRAAVGALQKAGIYEQVKSKLVYGENISQAAQFVQSGSAQVGLVALSLAVSPAMQSGDRWLVPQDFYPPLEQVAVVISASKNKSEALQFLTFVKSAKGRELLAKYGFTVPSDSGGEAKP